MGDQWLILIDVETATNMAMSCARVYNQSSRNPESRRGSGTHYASLHSSVNVVWHGWRLNVSDVLVFCPTIINKSLEWSPDSIRVWDHRVRQRSSYQRLEGCHWVTQTQTMSHTVESCPPTKQNGGLSQLHYRWRRRFVADQLWFMTCIWEEED